MYGGGYENDDYESSPQQDKNGSATQLNNSNKQDRDRKVQTTIPVNLFMVNNLLRQENQFVLLGNSKIDTLKIVAKISQIRDSGSRIIMILNDTYGAIEAILYKSNGQELPSFYVKFQNKYRENFQNVYITFQIQARFFKDQYTFAIQYLQEACSNEIIYHGLRVIQCHLQREKGYRPLNNQQQNQNQNQNNNNAAGNRNSLNNIQNNNANMQRQQQNQQQNNNNNQRNNNQNQQQEVNSTFDYKKSIQNVVKNQNMMKDDKINAVITLLKKKNQGKFTFGQVIDSFGGSIGQVDIKKKIQNMENLGVIYSTGENEWTFVSHE